MDKILDGVNQIEDLKNLDEKQKEQLAQELRELIIQTVSKTGGHLASNLGVVELTIALHSVYQVPIDKIIWDVGHQTYVHKILTGRKDKIDTLRQLDGLAGFPKTNESEADCFNTGHSSTSISVALGMARARDIEKKNYHVVAVIGDGALTGGMALEAINDAGSSSTNITVILNDNTMSISKNVGGISLFLSKLRTKKFYTKSNNSIRKAVKKIPVLGNGIVWCVRKIKHGIKQLLISNMMFEDMGFRYLGPVDGHNIEELESLISLSKDVEGPVLIHVITKKGKGYQPAEENPDLYHSSPAFDIETGKPKKEKTEDYSSVFGKKLVELAKQDDKIVAITAAMKDGTGLTEFANEFPERFFDSGIAEQHTLGMAAGMAKAGLKPVVPIYSSFFQRGYDQVIHDICIQNLPVVMLADRAGIVGNDGETHQGIFDLAFFNIVPNLTIMAPKDFEELEQMLEFSIHLNSPVVIRYPRGGEGTTKFYNHDRIKLGKAEMIQAGNDLTIVAIGKMVDTAKKVANLLEEKQVTVEVINSRFLKPLDEEMIIASIKKTRHVITIEDGITHGGLASNLSEIILKEKLENVYVKNFGYPDEFIPHGSVAQIEEIYGLTPKQIVDEICGEKNDE